MNCSPTIAIALLLLSLTAGMWLLYKTQKENLGAFFKVVGWFIIVISIGSMVCCGIRCIFKCTKGQYGCYSGMQCGMMKKGNCCTFNAKAGCEPGCEKACCMKDAKGCAPGCKKPCCAEKSSSNESDSLNE